jgi:methionyl-tRNA formyltransferase
MIIKIKKGVENLKIGIVGSRKELLKKVLLQKNINYFEIEQISDIDNTFDIVFGTGIYQLIKEPYLSLPAYGMIFFHETPLPEGKGNSPIQWTVFNKRPNLTVTAFKATETMDAGAILYQYNVPISSLDTLEILDNKRNIGIKKCFEEILEELKQGYIVLRTQTGQDSISAKRTPDDSEIDPNEILLSLWSKIRVCDNNKFPAFFKLKGKKIILRYEVEDLSQNE